MWAAILKPPGRVSLERVEKPEPGPGEVLLRVEACALCGTDKRVLAGEKPVAVPIIGHEIAGTVAAVGPGVTVAPSVAVGPGGFGTGPDGGSGDEGKGRAIGEEGVRMGGRYAVQTVIGCGECSMCLRQRQNLCEKGFAAIGYQFNGGFSEYLLMPERAVRQGCLIPIPSSMDAEIGTLLEPLSCGLNGLRSIPFEGMRHVIVAGAGIIGVLNGLIARARGARRVSIFNRSPERLAVLAGLGLPFDDLVDTGRIDPEAWIRAETGGRGADCVIVSASGRQVAGRGLGWLARDGHLSLFAGMPKSDCVEPMDLNLIHYRELHLHGANSSVRRDYLEALELLASGRIEGKSLITHRFLLKEFAQAIRTQSDAGSGALKVVIHP